MMIIISHNNDDNDDLSNLLIYISILLNPNYN